MKCSSGIWTNFRYIIFIKYAVINIILCETEWSYFDAPAWKYSQQSCGKLHQSPINILDSDATTIRDYLALHFENFEAAHDVKLENNGKTAKLVPPSAYNITVTVQTLSIREERYKLHEVHFHWGLTAHSGSEHKIDGSSSSMEMQLVLYNLKYTSIDVARGKNNGVLLLSVLVDVSTNVSLNSIWRFIANELAVIRLPGKTKKMTNVTFDSFLPGNTKDFYIYKGSFTTPPCSQKVTWIIFKERLLMPEEYLEEFKALQTTVNGTAVRLSYNVRPIQQLNSRTVLKTFMSPPSNKTFQTFVSRKLVDGYIVIGVLRFYPCHFPPSVAVAVLIPELDIFWKSANRTSDLPKSVPLDKTTVYGVTLEMHDHPRGIYAGRVHVIMKVRQKAVVDDYYELNDECVQDLCFWTSVGKKRLCTWPMINSDDKLLFTLTKLDLCGKTYRVEISQHGNVIFDEIMSSQTRVKVKPNALDYQWNATLTSWYLSLFELKNGSVSHTKVYLDTPDITLSERRLLMEGLFENGLNCKVSSGGAKTPGHLKLIIGLVVGVLMIILFVLSLFLVWKTYKHSSSRSNLLEQEVLTDTSV